MFAQRSSRVAPFPYRQFSPGSLPYFAVTAHPGSSPRHSTARAIGFSCSTPLRCPRNPNFAFFTRPGQVECPVKSISLVIRQKRNLLSLRYPAANANSLLSFFLFFFAVEKRMEREERIIVIDISFRRNEDGETKRWKEEGRSYDTRAGLPRCLFILANSTRISGITGKLACHPDNIPRITCTPFRWQKKKKKKKKHSRQQRRRKFPANFSARESIDRESKNRVTRSREVRTSSALPRAGLASWIDRRRGSIGEGREARAYGRVVPVWACKKH